MIKYQQAIFDVFRLMRKLDLFDIEHGHSTRQFEAEVGMIAADYFLRSKTRTGING